VKESHITLADRRGYDNFKTIKANQTERAAQHGEEINSFGDCCFQERGSQRRVVKKCTPGLQNEVGPLRGGQRDYSRMINMNNKRADVGARE